MATLPVRPLHDGIALVSLITIGNEVIGLLPIAAVDLVLVYEAHHVDGVFGFELEVIDLLWIDENVLPFGVLVAFDDFLVWHLGEGVTIVDALHVPNGRVMYLPEGNRLFCRDGGH